MLGLRRGWTRGVGRDGSGRREDLVLGGRRSGLLRGGRIPWKMGDTERGKLFLPALYRRLA